MEGRKKRRPDVVRSGAKLNVRSLAIFEFASFPDIDVNVRNSVRLLNGARGSEFTFRNTRAIFLGSCFLDGSEDSKFKVFRVPKRKFLTSANLLEVSLLIRHPYWR